MIALIVAAAVVAVAVIALWPPTPAALRRFVQRFVGFASVLPRAKHNRLDLIGWLARRPALFGAVNAYEAAVLASNGVETRLKYLAVLKTSSLAGCPF